MNKAFIPLFFVAGAILGQEASIVPENAGISIRMAQEGQAKAMGQIKGKEREAVILYKKLLNEKPNAALQKELPYLLNRAGKEKEAASAFEQLGIERLSTGDFWTYLAALKATGQVPKMESAMETRIVKTGNIDMLTAYVSTKRNYNRMREAIPTLQKTIDQFPKNTTIASTSAEALSELGDTSLSREILRKAIKNNPGAAKLYVIAARIEEIDRQPKKALELLQQAIALDPTYAEPRRTAYRMLMNNDQISRAEAIIAQVFSPSVDSQLILHAQLLSAETSGKSPFELYEALQESPNPKIQQAIKQLKVVYQQQKAAWLERDGITTLKAGETSKAIGYFEALSEIEPNNAAALYGKAEAQRSSNDIEGAQNTYTLLAQSYPNDRTAAGALRELQDARRPTIRSIFQVNSEDSPGRLANIVQYSWQASYKWEANKNLVIAAGPKLWILTPRGGTTYTAQGGTIEAILRINKKLSMNGYVTLMKYNQNSAKSNVTGGINVVWKASDKFEIGAGVGRENVIHNSQNIIQGTQADIISANAKYKANPYINAYVGGKLLRYSDNNMQIEGIAQIEGAIIKKPGELKVAASILGLNTQYESTSSTGQNRIKYPYWTPTKYVQGSATLSWEQNLAPHSFAGQNELSYGAKVFISYDSTNNLLLGAGAHLRWELIKNLVLEAGIKTERSKAWNGGNAYLSSEYRF